LLADGHPENEQPDTPAPVFAARALKSAIFGTPAPLDDTMFEDEDTKDAVMRAGRDTTKTQARNTSPTKPQGILLTPGTAAARRKTVSFGNEVLDNAGEKTGGVRVGSKSGIPDDCPGKFPSPWVSTTEDSARLARRTSLTRSLEKAREGKTAKAAPDSERSSFESQLPPSTSSEGIKDLPAAKPKTKDPDLPQLTTRTSSRSQQRDHDSLDDVVKAMHPHPNNDATVDLNEPYSQSGKYWKTEFEQYHEEAKAEMEKLLKYKVLAKSYARLKDDQANALSAQLKAEQHKVTKIENRVSQLSAQMASPDQDGVDKSPEMIKQLAQQIALALQYKAEVEEFRATLESSGRQSNTSNTVHRRTSSLSKKGTGVEAGANGAAEELGDVGTLLSELEQLRKSLANAVDKNTKLQEENAKLTQELLHADLRHTTHLENCDRRRESLDVQLKRKDERLQNLQKDYDTYKEITKKSRRDTEHLLKKRHDQLVELRKEIASLRGAEVTAQELQEALHMKTLVHEEVITHLQKQSEKLQESREQNMIDDQSFNNTEEGHSHSLGTSTTRSRGPPINETLSQRESQIPVLTSISRLSKAVVPSKSMRSEGAAPSRPRSSNRALSEIVNGANVDTVPPEGFGLVQRTPLPLETKPLPGQYAGAPLDSPGLEPSSPELSLPLHNSSRAIHEKNCYASPRPSMFNMPSSPPKNVFLKPTTTELNKQMSTNNLVPLVSTGSTNPDMSRVRREMPPDRMAAAKARLEEKKRLKGLTTHKESFRT
jgi:regulator of replication initiation timing/plasmid maintenance system antidote protein VapI